VLGGLVSEVEGWSHFRLGRIHLESCCKNYEIVRCLTCASDYTSGVFAALKSNIGCGMNSPFCGLAFSPKILYRNHLGLSLMTGFCKFSHTGKASLPAKEVEVWMLY